MIAGIRSNGTVDRQTLEIAKKNLEKSFSVVGISERFEESLVLIARTFGWEVPFYENRKVSKSRPKIDPIEIELIKKHNQFDLELYEYGKALFEASLTNKEAEVREGLATLRKLPKPGSIETFYKSTVGAGRFLMTKIASAV